MINHECPVCGRWNQPAEEGEEKLTREITRLTAENEKLRSRSITLRTEHNGSTAGQRIIVSVHDGEHEWDVIEEFGALPDISIHHSVTPFGVEERRARSIVGDPARAALEQP